MDFGQIAAAVSSLKVAGAIELNQQLIAAQHQVFAANAAQSTLVDRVRELEGEIARMKNWDAQKQRYKLAAPSPGGMVYALQKSMSEGEPPHYLCASCFKKGQPSILQGREGRPLGKDKGYAQGCYACPECGSEAATGYMDYPAPEYAEDIKPRT